MFDWIITKDMGDEVEVNALNRKTEEQSVEIVKKEKIRYS